MSFINWLWNSFVGKIILTFFLSMVPVIELRGAIPLAVAHELNFWVAFPVAVLGNLVPVPFIILFIRKIFDWMKKKSEKLSRLVDRMELKAQKKSAVVEKYKMLGLFILVAIPLPGTGAWTGALVAAMLNMRIKNAILPIALGVVTAGIIMAVISFSVKGAIGLM